MGLKLKDTWRTFDCNLFNCEGEKHKKSEEKRDKWRIEENTHSIFEVPSFADLVLILLVHFIPLKQRLFPDLLLQFLLKAELFKRIKLCLKPSSTDCFLLYPGPQVWRAFPPLVAPPASLPVTVQHVQPSDFVGMMS